MGVYRVLASPEISAPGPDGLILRHEFGGGGPAIVRSPAWQNDGRPSGEQVMKPYPFSLDGLPPQTASLEQARASGARLLFSSNRLR